MTQQNMQILDALKSLKCFVRKITHVEGNTHIPLHLSA